MRPRGRSKSGAIGPLWAERWNASTRKKRIKDFGGREAAMMLGEHAEAAAAAAAAAANAHDKSTSKCSKRARTS